MQLISLLLVVLQSPASDSGRVIVPALDVSHLPAVSLTAAVSVGQHLVMSRMRPADLWVSTEEGVATVGRTVPQIVLARTSLVILNPSDDSAHVVAKAVLLAEALKGRELPGDQLIVVGWNDSATVVYGPNSSAQVLAQIRRRHPGETTVTTAAALRAAARVLQQQGAEIASALLFLPKRGPTPPGAAAIGKAVQSNNALLVIAGGESGTAQRGEMESLGALNAGDAVERGALLWATLSRARTAPLFDIDLTLPSYREGMPTNLALAVLAVHTITGDTLQASVPFVAMAPGRRIGGSAAATSDWAHGPSILVGTGALVLVTTLLGLLLMRRRPHTLP